VIFFKKKLLHLFTNYRQLLTFYLLGLTMRLIKILNLIDKLYVSV
jgi:hypothetical protein